MPVKPLEKVAPVVVHLPSVPTVVVASNVFDELYNRIVVPTGPVPVMTVPAVSSPELLVTVIAGVEVVHITTVCAVLFAAQ